MEKKKESPAFVMAIELTEPVNTLLLAMTLAKCEKERCEAIQAKVLAEGVYTYRPDYAPRYLGRITKVDDAWMMTEFDFRQYWDRVDAEYRRVLKFDGPKDQCPALVAEELQREAEREVIKVAEKWFPSATVDRLLCGSKEKNGLETYREYVDLLIKLVVNRTGYVPVKLPTKQVEASHAITG